MSVKLSAAALARLPAGVAAPKYRRSDLQRRHRSYSASAIFTARIRRSISTICSTPGATTTGRSSAPACATPDVDDAREAQGAGLADDGRRAGGGYDQCPRHRLDDRFRQALRYRGDSRRARRARHPHRLADRHRGRLLHLAGDAAFRSRPSRHRLRRAARRRAEDGLRTDRRRPQAPPRRGHRAFHRDVLRQHPGQRPRHRERRRRPRRACRSRTRALDSRQRRLSQFHGRPHHAGDDRPRTRHSARQVRPRGQLAGLLRGVPAMGGGGQVPSRAAGAGDGRRHVHLRRRALRTDEDPHPQWRSRGDRLSGGAARHPFRPRGDGGRTDPRVPRKADQKRDPAGRSAAAQHQSRRLSRADRAPLRQSEDRRHHPAPLPRRLEPPAEIHPALGRAIG